MAQTPAERYAAYLTDAGPDRMYITQGISVPYAHAHQLLGFEWDTIFIRDDGWTVGARTVDENTVKTGFTWAFYMRRGAAIRPIAQWPA